jgi:dsDNA-binding SOS-regulon protein
LKQQLSLHSSFFCTTAFPAQPASHSPNKQALSRFVARLGEKALPFYAPMKKSDDKFEWTEEADATFAQLKKVLSTPPVLVAPKEKEPLLLYIAATHQVVSTVLVVKRSEEGKAHGVQRPVYFISEVLSLTK